MEGEFLYWGSERIWGGGLWGQAFLSVRTPLGRLEGGSFAGDLCVEDGSGDGHHFP